MKRIYEVLPVTGTPDWSQLPVAPVDQILWRPNYGIRACAQMAYSADRLFVRMEAREPHPLARRTGPCEAVSSDSCMECFFCPRPDDDCYLNFEWNPLGTLYLGFGRNMQLHARQLLEDPKLLFAFHPFSAAGGWGFTFEIPIEFLRRYAPDLVLRAGTAMAGNFYKCGDETEHPHYLAWNPVQCPTPNFHRPDQFGIFQLIAAP